MFKPMQLPNAKPTSYANTSPMHLFKYSFVSLWAPGSVRLNDTQL